jgi:hypothetical protein
MTKKEVHSEEENVRCLFHDSKKSFVKRFVLHTTDDSGNSNRHSDRRYHQLFITICQVII